MTPSTKTPPKLNRLAPAPDRAPKTQPQFYQTKAADLYALQNIEHIESNGHLNHHQVKIAPYAEEGDLLEKPEELYRNETAHQFHLQV
ncbi:hypothetical protein AA106555_0300 [Neokomagataea thailandica NBRC 106555]|uniref:Uncharacterized protein n=1 Tax=Neokomagataea thailandica NBRC 106555 TaxID=1223520 RepID=A0ABQ0QMR1_9PROT|nr:hypothetical protein AA106555_0300 [Neokomagataea thailandica NBRC 106555]